ncbi:hypothetical protein PIB30_040171 [Stylosanthes scabra]|uniref:Transmembrane protein n=1 Tax=Stylosanthes scabra TaxID=79078 RepID=A0ABU6XFG7_9FABA|nr:hypothetical protein [Stylosanthes scabra]
MSDLISQVGSPNGMWARWVRSAFCVVWLNRPSKIGPRWAPSLGLEFGYEHCPYAELWLLMGALRVTEHPQNECDPCRCETRFQVRRCPFSFFPLLQPLTRLPIIITNLSNSLFPSLLSSRLTTRRSAVALSRALGSSSSCVADVRTKLSFFLFISHSSLLFQMIVVLVVLDLLVASGDPFLLFSGNPKVEGGRGRDSGFGTSRTFPEFNSVFVLCYIPCRVNLFLICVCWSSDMVPVALFPSSCTSRVFTSSLFLFIFVGFIAMARGDVNIRPSNVPEDMDWVDDLVLLPQFVMDEELLAKFRESHAVCGTVSEESQYELVPPTRK